MPEETKRLLTDAHIDVERVLAAIAGLREDVRRGRAARIAQGVIGGLAIIALIVALVAIDSNASKIQELACLIVGGSPDDPARPIIHTFRVKYDCPAFDPSRAKQYGTPLPTVTVTATATPTAAPVRPRGVHGPRATATMTAPGPTATVTAPGSRRTTTRTVMRTRTATRTVLPVPLPCTPIPGVPLC